MKAAALLASLLVAAGAAAKPLYLTVPRSYGTQEPPAIDVAFEARGPVELRVLRPSSLETFVAGQADLRRAYVEPPSFKNPGRALSRGLDGMRAPGDYLVLALGNEVRKSLAATLPARPEKPPRALPRLAQGPERQVGVPAGFTVVHSQWLNLDLGGESREFDVPGFGMWHGESRYQERHIVLDPLPAGAYLVQVVQDRIEGQVVLVVTDLAAQVKQTDGKLLVRVAGRDQRGRSGALVRVWHAGGGKGPTGWTDASGEALLDEKEPKVLVAVASGNDVAVVDTDFYSTLAATPDVFVYSDRPVYKPGDEVKFRGLVRKPDGMLARLFAPRARTVGIELVSQEGRQVSTNAEVDEFGAFHGELKVPADVGAGVLRIAAKVDDQIHGGEARVQDYVKPTFYLELQTESETIRPGGSLRAKVRARRYAGGVPAGARYEVFLYRSLLDTPAWVDDAGMGGQGSAVTYGSTSTTEGRLSIPERQYSSIEKRLRGNDFDPRDPWRTAPAFDSSGEAIIDVPIPPLKEGDDRLPYRYSLSIRARDDQDTFANASASLFLSPVEILGSLRFGAPVVQRNEQVTLSVRGTTLSGKPYGGAEGNVEFAIRQPDGSESELGHEHIRLRDDGVATLTVRADRPGALIARATLADAKGAIFRAEAQALVLGADGELVVRVPALTLSALGGPVEPGRFAELVALFPDDWSASRRVWVTLSGTSLFSTTVVAAKGTTLVHRFRIERRFGSAVYASIAYPTRDGRWEERTVAFRIARPERELRVHIEPLAAEAKPLTEQTLSLRVTDHLGRGVRAQVSIGVVDKAVYAIQSEFRPRVLDFFYPMVRDNVATFTSSEFQGYGYGERLARAMSLAPRHAFASIKPPTRNASEKERDTAFWDPALVTDGEGRAKVSFRLPRNQTLWTVTAVAADADGRFGEGTAGFASRGQMNVYAALPQFLREGDIAKGSVRVSARERALVAEVAISGGGAVQPFQSAEAVAVAAGGEVAKPFEIDAAKVGTARIDIRLSAGKDTMLDSPSLPVRAASIEETLEVSRWGGGQLTVDVPEGAVLDSTEIELRASTVHAALGNLRELLTYPYGCLEQLVATSVPDIAIASLLQRTGANLDARSRALLAEARSRALQGTQRVLALAVRGGGFTWFAGYSDPSVPMTIIALDGLTYAIDAGLVDRTDPRIVESSRWLEAQQGLPFELDAARAYALARLEGPEQAARVRQLLERAAPGPDLYPLALAVLAAEASGIVHEPALRDRVSRIVNESRDAFLRPASSFDARGAFWRYPLREVGRAAVLGHAASLGTIDLASARRRLVELLSQPDLSTFDRSTALLHGLWLIEQDARDLRDAAKPRIELHGGTATVGEFDGVAVLRAKVHTPLRSVRMRAEGLSIDRTYWVLREGGPVPLGPQDTVRIGDEIYVELRLAAGEGRSRRSAYTVVEDPVPAGFTPLEEDKPFRGAPHSLPLQPEALKRRIFTPERVTFFLEEPAPWSRKPSTVGYVMRAQFAGRFAAPPATVQDMYATEMRARTGAAVLEIAER